MESKKYAVKDKNLSGTKQNFLTEKFTFAGNNHIDMKRIFLIGYMGAGKTTVGKVLSRQLELSFIDLDHYIEGRYHKTVGQLFAEKGEDAFRDIERRMLREVAAFEDVLVSTGGGAPCFSIIWSL